MPQRSHSATYESTIDATVDPAQGSLSIAAGLATILLMFALIPTVSFAFPDTVPDWVAAEGDENDNFGSNVNTAGDVNGDGFSDIIISCPGLNSDLGAAFVYCGGPDGLSSSACWQSDGTQSGRQYANKSSPAGDVNGDGYADVIVGARGYDSIGPSNTFEGAVFVFHGSPSGLSTTADWQVDGEIEDMELGWSVSSAGDANGDGFDDVLVYANHNGGIIRLYFGSVSGLSTSWDWSVTGFGAALGAAGDVNGDGYDDIIVGRDIANRADVFFGSATGPLSSPDWTSIGPSASSYGRSVASAGDVDGDGYADILIGAPQQGTSMAMASTIYSSHRNSTRTTYFNKDASIATTAHPLGRARFPTGVWSETSSVDGWAGAFPRPEMSTGTDTPTF